jgi:hypothetical protein
MSNSNYSRGRVTVVLCALAALVMLMPSITPAQETPPKVEFFAGYSWLNQSGRVATAPPPTATSPTTKLKSITDGWNFAPTVNFNKWIGVEGDVGGHYSTPVNLATVMVGPRITFRGEHFTPFIHVLGGFGRLSPQNLSAATGFAAVGGGGIDMWFTRHFGVRIIQADYLYQAYRVKDIGGSAKIDGVRVQGGIVFGFGGAKKAAVTPTAACSLQPTAVLAGEPAMASVSTQNFNAKHPLRYEWETSGGKLTRNEQAATIDTTGLAPGSYTVTARVHDPKGPKEYNVATCDAVFTVNEPPKHPPTISCSANPTTVRSGDPVAITCESSSPDKRPLNYEWHSSAGRVSGTGATATLDTTGAPAGAVTVTTTVSDDRGLSTSFMTAVNAEVPPPPPQATRIGEIAFPNKVKPWRVDNTAKAVLDDVALRLQREPDAKGVIIGFFEPHEKGGVNLARERAVNTKVYLTDEKGIDPGRIELGTGTAGGTRAEVYLLPAGAMFNVPGTQLFNEAAVKKPAAQRVVPRRGARPKRTAAPPKS